MKRVFYLIIFFTALFTSSFTLHKYYSSITKVEIDDKEQLLKVYSQVFADDFEKVMFKRYDLEIGSFSSLNEREKELIGGYVINKLQFKVNRSLVQLQFLGCELKGELLYLYVEGKLEQEVKRLDVENTLLQDVFSEQRNTVDVSYKNEVKSMHLHAQNNSGILFY